MSDFRTAEGQAEAELVVLATGDTKKAPRLFAELSLASCALASSLAPAASRRGG